MAVPPSAQNRALSLVATLDREHDGLEFQNRDHREEQAPHAGSFS
jgi:hypothetical protein